MNYNEEFFTRLQELINQYKNIDISENTLLIGASHFTFWKEKAEEDLSPNLKAINFGIGGTTALFWKINMNLFKTFKYQPKNILLSIGGNDISQNCSNEETINRIISVFNQIKDIFPKTNIYFVGMFSSPCKIKDGRNQKQKEVSLAIDQYIETEKDKNLFYIDTHNFVYKNNSNILDNAYNKNIDLNLFLDDNLHLNQNGFKLFGETIKKYFTSKYQ